MYYQSWMMKNPAFSALRGCMLSYESMLKNVKEPSLPNIPVPEAKAAMETYIAGTYGPIVVDALQWDSPLGRSLLTPKLRTTVEKIVKDHPQPTTEEVSKAKTLLQPLLDTRVAQRAKELGIEGRKHMLDFVSLSVMGMYLLFTAFLSLFCAVAFRGGLIMRILGIAVVTNTGADASRFRMLWRSLIAWSPILLSPILIIIFSPLMEKAADQETLRVIGWGAAVVVSLALSIAALASRGRGLHDRLARTWLVPS
jgi:cytochrome c oxidase subunit IV